MRRLSSLQTWHPASNTQRLDGAEQAIGELRDRLGSLEGRLDDFAETIGRIVAEAVAQKMGGLKHTIQEQTWHIAEIKKQQQ